MKVFYLYYYKPNLPGVNNKIISKIKSLNELGIDVTILCFTSESNLPHLKDFKVIYVKPQEQVKLPRIFNLKYLSFCNQIISNYNNYKYLKSILINLDFDLLIMRYGTANYFFNKLVLYFKYKFIFEHNTHELEQLKLRYKGIFKSHSWITYEYLSEKYCGSKVLSNAAGLIGVTNEITNYERSRISDKNLLPLSITISNGIEVDKFPINIPDNIKNEINLVMILGVNAEWHGLDRIINGLKNYKGNEKVTLYIIGKVNEIKCANVVYLGYLNTEQMNSFFCINNIHLGIASLALHRINIKEASVLKAREYLARGIPFVLGYIDTDFENNIINERFIYHVDANDTDIDVEKLVQFYNRVALINNYPQEIRNLAKEKVDMSVKISQYKRFLDDIVKIKNAF